MRVLQQTSPNLNLQNVNIDEHVFSSSFACLLLMKENLGILFLRVHTQGIRVSTIKKFNKVSTMIKVYIANIENFFIKTIIPL